MGICLMVGLSLGISQVRSDYKMATDLHMVTLCVASVADAE
jgi:hypothetical protein